MLIILYMLPSNFLFKVKTFKKKWLRDKTNKIFYIFLAINISLLNQIIFHHFYSLFPANRKVFEYNFY